MNLDKVLKDLHAEKQWLESMIGALETASISPAHRLIRSLDQSLWHDRRTRGLRLDARRRTELAKLAKRIDAGCRNGPKGRGA
jgi:hypothetical protein